MLSPTAFKVTICDLKRVHSSLLSGKVKVCWEPMPISAYGLIKTSGRNAEKESQIAIEPE